MTSLPASIPFINSANRSQALVLFGPNPAGKTGQSLFLPAFMPAFLNLQNTR
jgi:hypothetical protein